MRFLTIFTLLFLAACGQTGKLYLPDPVQPEPVAPATAIESTTETAETASPDKARFEAELKPQPQKQP
jgi:predicted small lipoprotein YifL